MEFVKDGPDVPERLLQAHEEGNVVFFCGAGISYPAGLPGFGKLVKDLYKEMGVTPDEVQKGALLKHQYDTAISLLESINESKTWRTAVREKMADLLVPIRTDKKATRTHKALLELSKTQNKQTRLITTNFDKIFENVIQDDELQIKSFQAPLLPVPKSRWDGLVYLHGLLPENKEASELDQLVVSSGDFGLAYLTERWAARFVSELFRTYTVCFVGYSLDDPILRYMMDALAADKLLGEKPPEMYAFGSYSKGKYDTEYKHWKSKNVTPILYKMKSHHLNLHETLVKWSETYRDGLNGKQQIVVTTAFTNPNLNDLTENSTKRLVWAISDSRGLAARTFAEMVPSPSLRWLFAFTNFELTKSELPRFDVPDENYVKNFTFNLMNRPANSSLTPNMSLLGNVPLETKLDDVMKYLIKWLVTHLNDPALLLYICNNGGRIHSEFEREVRFNLQLQREKRLGGDTAYFQEKAVISESYIVSKEMLTFWDLFLNSYLSIERFSADMYSWVEDYKLSGLTVGLKRDLLRILAPKVILKKRSSFWNEYSNPYKALFDWELTLNASTHSGLKRLREQAAWFQDSSRLILDFSSLLNEVMELRATLNEVTEKDDYSYLYQPSIKDHPQNKDFRNWTILIELTRDAWLSLNKNNPTLAAKVAEDWWLIPFPIFKRLAFFAASEESEISAALVLDWLIQEDSFWLWSANTQREVFQLLPKLFKKLSSEQVTSLTNILLVGPSRSYFREGLSDDELIYRKNRIVWLKLEKLRISDIDLNLEASLELTQLKHNYPEWTLSEDGSDEFPVWSSSGNRFDRSEVTPKDYAGLLEWLEKHKDFGHWDENDWSSRCKNDFDLASDALISLCNRSVWAPEACRRAIRVWLEDENLNDLAWNKVKTTLLNLPAEFLIDVSWDFSRWVEKRLKSDKLDSTIFLQCFDVLVDTPHKVDLDDHKDPLNAAINHPIGIMTENLFKWWYKSNPKVEGGIDVRFSSKITKLLHSSKHNRYIAKSIIASNLLQLHKIDPNWTESNIVSWFDWEDIELATLAWRSYLWSARLNRGLLSTLKPYLLQTASHFAKLDSQSEQYAQLLTYTALQLYPEYKLSEFAEPFRLLPEEGLKQAASSLEYGLSNSGERRNEYWSNRVKPFLKIVWPKQAKINEETVNKLGLLCVKANEHFEEAFNLLKHFFYHTRYNDYVVTSLEKTDLLEIFPESSLLLLDKLIGEPEYRPPNKLKSCLLRIREKSPNSATTPEFIRLWEIVERFR